MPKAEGFVKGLWCFAPCPQRHLAPSEEPLARPAQLPGTVELEPFNRDKKNIFKNNKVIKHRYSPVCFFVFGCPLQRRSGSSHSSGFL